MNAEAKLLTVKQTAERLGVNRQRVMQLINANRLPAQKLGAYYTILESDVELLNQQDRKAGRPLKTQKDGSQTNAPAISFAEAAAEFLGKHKNLPPDLSTNKDYLEGMGRD